MATEPTALTQPHDCGRSIAGIVREIDELKAAIDRVRALADHLAHDGDLIAASDIRSAIAGGAR